MQMKLTIGKYIRKLRHEKGYTLTKLAAMLDMDSANLSKIENGIRDLDIKKLVKLAEIFQLDYSSLSTEYFSEKIAKIIINHDCELKALKLAEKKIEYLRAE